MHAAIATVARIVAAARRAPLLRGPRCFRIRSLLPVDRSLLRRVDVVLGAGLEEERLHLPREEGAGLRIHQVEAVVVDQHHLLPIPLCPAILTDLRGDARADLTWKWGSFEASARLAAARAGDIRHETSVRAARARYQCGLRPHAISYQEHGWPALRAG